MPVLHRYGYRSVNSSTNDALPGRSFDQHNGLFDKAQRWGRISQKICLCVNTMKYPAPKSATLVGHQMAFLTIIGFWVFHALIVSLRATVLELPEPAELVWRRIFVTLVGVFLTWLLYLLLRRFDRRPLGFRVATAFALSMPCALMIAFTNYYVFNIYDPISMFSDPNIDQQVEEIRAQIGWDFWQEIAELTITRYFFIIAWASLYLTLGYAREVREAERTASRYAQAAQDAELRSLRYQVNPHFLFNTLNSLSSLVIKGDNVRAEAMIQSLSGFYRTSLSNDPLEDVTLIEEVELQQRYLEIEMVRYPERLRVVIDIPPDVGNTKVPGMILQPLIENAIKYGVSRTNRPVTVTIAAQRIGNTVQISVTDDGDAITAKQHSRDGNGIGLANVRDRIEARYGERGQLRSGPQGTGGFAANITIADEDLA
jgi:two-component system, LytTR family, sensor kinase